MGKSEKDCVFDIPFDILVACKIVPVKRVLLGVRHEHRARMFLKNWHGICVFLLLLARLLTS